MFLAFYLVISWEAGKPRVSAREFPHGEFPLQRRLWELSANEEAAFRSATISKTSFGYIETGPQLTVSALSGSLRIYVRNRNMKMARSLENGLSQLAAVCSFIC